MHMCKGTGECQPQGINIYRGFVAWYVVISKRKLTGEKMDSLGTRGRKSRGTTRRLKAKTEARKAKDQYRKRGRKNWKGNISKHQRVRSGNYGPSVHNLPQASLHFLQGCKSLTYLSGLSGSH